MMRDAPKVTWGFAFQAQPPRVENDVNDHRDSQNQDVALTLDNLYPYMSRTRNHCFRDHAHFLVALPHATFVVHDVILDLQVRATADLDCPAVAYWRDNCLSHLGHYPTIRSFDLHRVLDPQLVFLNLAQFFALRSSDLSMSRTRRSLPSTTKDFWSCSFSFQKSQPMTLSSCYVL
jgi:hypothetical protein